MDNVYVLINSIPVKSGLWDGWMDDLRFYVLLNSISVISGQCLDDNERLCAMELRLRLRRFPSSGDRTQSASSVGQRLTHWTTGAPRTMGE